MKKTILSVIIATSVLAVAPTVSAQITILTDNFTVASGGDANNQLAARQTGAWAPSAYTQSGQDQTGNTGTDVGQPGGAANSDYLLLYNGGWVYNDLAFNDKVVNGGALSISFNIYQGVFNKQNATDWTCFSIGTGTPAPNRAGQFGFLVRGNGGMQVFNGNSEASNESTQDAPGYVTSDGWTVILSGNADGTGSPFDGTTYVQLYNNSDPAQSPAETGLGLVISFQLTTPLASGDTTGFLCADGSGDYNESGIANIDILALGSTNYPPSPILTQDTLPSHAETVVGDGISFTADYSNSPPANLQWVVISGGVTNNVAGANVSGANTTTLTITNLQVTNSAYYSLEAVNATNSGLVTYSSPAQLLVSNAPAAEGGMITSFADQWGVGSISPENESTNFYSTWTPDINNDLIYESFPNATGNGNFGLAGCNGDPSVLTDGAIGYFSYDSGSATEVSCGAANANAGQSVTYTLPSAAYGYDITNIVVYGGWGDNSQDEQKYQVWYSTPAAPNNFNYLTSVDYLPPGVPAGDQVATRTTLSAATTNGLVQGVAAIEFIFQVSPGPENGYSGYSEIIVQGQPSTSAAPELTQDIAPATAVTVVGDQISFSPQFSGAMSYQWLKNGTNIPGATSATLTLNNLQVTDTATNPGYSLEALNNGVPAFSGACALTVNPIPAAVTNVITEIAAQTESGTSFTPTWTIDTANDLIYNETPGSSAGDFDLENQAGDRNVDTLTEGGSLEIQLVGSPTTCSPNYVTAGNDDGNAGANVTYLLTNSVNGYNLTNITVYGGWADAGRDQQAYTVYYATAANPANFVRLAVVNYLPADPSGWLSGTRATLVPATGSLATNVGAVMFNFTSPPGENGYQGYAQITVSGFASATAPSGPVEMATYETNATPDWVVASPNLIAGQLPSSYDTNAGDSFTADGEGGNSNGGLPALTDGVIGTAIGEGASCGGAGQGGGTFVTYTPTNGSWTLTNIVVYTGWPDFGRVGQFYNLSYSTAAAPTTFLPLTSVFYNPSFNTGTPWATRVIIAPPVGQTVLATNVAAVHFDFTPQGTLDYGYSSYTEIVLQGTNVPSVVVIPPVLSTPRVSAGNLILTGMNGTPNSSYTLLTATNLSPPVIWTTNTTGTLNGSGGFSNSIPISPNNPGRFFRLELP